MGAKQAAELVRDGMLSIHEATKFAGLCRAELYKLMGRGELPYAIHGRRRLIPKAALVELLAKKVVG